MEAGRRKAIKAGDDRSLGLPVDEINLRIVIGIIHVIGGGHDESKVCQSLQRVDIGNRDVQISMRIDNDREWAMPSSDGQVVERLTGTNRPLQ